MYIGYLPRSKIKSEAEIFETYSRKLEVLYKNGIWNIQMSDVLLFDATNRKKVST